MKGFQKLALVSAIAALPVSGFAMEALDDATMADVTGQDGISISLGLNQTMNVIIDDTDGLTGANPALIPTGFGVANTGSIIITNNQINGDATIDIDAGGNGTDGVLLVQVGLAAGFTLDTGDISVGNTEPNGAVTGGGGAVILDSVNINFTNAVNLGIQLGEGAENFHNIVDGNIGTLSITNFALNDVAAGGSITADQIDISGLDLSGTTASLDATGLVISTVGATNLNNVGITMTQLSLDGGTTAVGDIYITGLDMSGQTITINGK